MTTILTALAQDIGLARETDYFLMKDQLTEDELGLMHKVRKFGETEILPVVSTYWERGEFPFELVPRLAGLNIVGDTMAGYGTTPMSAVGAGLLAYELSRADGSIATFFAVHVGLAMQSIYLLGSEEQRQRWLPPMARLEKIGAFALTEPDHGSDAVILEATARRDGSEWVINGRKRWPGNAVWCDVIVAFARDIDDGQVKGFVVEKGNPGYAASKIEGKVSLRLVQNADITLSNCRVTAMQLYCIRLGRLIGDGKMSDTMASLAKCFCTVKARHVCHLARDVLGGNGILLDFHVIRHLCDMEALVTYEGTAEIRDAVGYFYHQRPRQVLPAACDNAFQDQFLDYCASLTGIALPAGRPGWLQTGHGGPGQR